EELPDGGRGRGRGNQLDGADPVPGRDRALEPRGGRWDRWTPRAAPDRARAGGGNDGSGTSTGGRRERARLLRRAAVLPADVRSSGIASDGERADTEGRDRGDRHLRHAGRDPATACRVPGRGDWRGPAPPGRG